MGKLRAFLASRVEQEPLSARHRDHPLRGIWKGYREAHLEPDWLLSRNRRRGSITPEALPRPGAGFGDFRTAGDRGQGIRGLRV